MASNGTNTRKRFASVAGEPRSTSEPQKYAAARNKGPVYEGQIGGLTKERFAEPEQAVSARVRGMESLKNDIGESSGFITDGYLDKQGTPYGEAARFNHLPPGMDISNQENAEIHSMPLKTLTATSYPGDTPWPMRDLPE